MGLLSMVKVGFLRTIADWSYYGVRTLLSKLLKLGEGWNWVTAGGGWNTFWIWMLEGGRLTMFRLDIWKFDGDIF